MANLSQVHTDLTSERELESVAHEIQDNLLPHIAIDISRFVPVEWWALHDQTQSGFLADRLKVAREFRRKGA